MKSYENIREPDTQKLKDWIGTPEIICLSNESVSGLETRETAGLRRHAQNEPEDLNDVLDSRWLK